MPRPLSIEVRERIIHSWQAGELTWREIAARNQVSVATVNRLIRRFRQTGSLAARPHAGGRRRIIGPDGLDLIRRLLAARPGSTLEELAAAYAAQTGVSPSIPTMHRAVRRISRARRTAQPGSDDFAAG